MIELIIELILRFKSMKKKHPKFKVSERWLTDLNIGRIRE